jgi:uncharacterized protein (TIGR03067 family)
MKKHQAPSTKHQRSIKFQTPACYPNGRCFKAWSLGFVWSLGFGIWCFCPAGIVQAVEEKKGLFNEDKSLLDYHAAAEGTGSGILLAQKAESGFQSLFNGKDLAGWDGNPKLWSVKDGVITGQTTAENPAPGNTFLIWTNGDVADFELRCSFKVTPGDDKHFANSGVQYRSKIVDSANWVVAGYQADMEAGPTYTGILYEEKMRGILALRGEKVIWGSDCKKKVVGSLGKPEEIQSAIKQGDWNDYVIIAQGNHLRQFINGKQTVDVTDECEAQAAKSGILALQLHAGAPMMAQFRNIRLRTIAGEKKSAMDDMKTMQGVWRVTSAEANGSPSEEVAKSVVTIRDNSWKLVNGDENDSGTFKIDPSKNPKQMDIHRDSGDDDIPAIYEVDSDTMRICYGLQGERPTAFKTTEDSGRVLITYKRK